MLKIAVTVSAVHQFLEDQKSKGALIGFVPTMGALHSGHISLIEKARKENDIVVCSIFVNPAQFNDPNDLTNYPKTPEADHHLLDESGCDLLFEPGVSEVYPGESQFDMDFGDLEKVMEGKFRPGHFKGVAKVVSRLFDIVQPDSAYFGEKDFQQLAIIREMNKKLGSKVKVVGCKTLRDERGLALSSRNIHLTEEEFQAAPSIYESLQMAMFLIKEYGVGEARTMLISRIEHFQEFKVQYLEFVDAFTLQPIQKLDTTKEQRACIAVLTTKTRLIDNVAL
jgi:pantoate--beta-alanine ligase